jgi:23S rRNA U2552 (ribose-2'-O)-methylase RlmE/FtsJ
VREWAQAKAKGMRSRAAFKLEQINAKHKILRPGV